MNDTFRMSTLRKCLRSSLGIVSPLFLILVLVHSALAQTMVFVPSCGEAGKTKVCVTGSGWAEPAPPCFYRFFFNNNQVVFPDQPDGLFGPPQRSFIVPAGTAPGSYPIKVELRITSNNQLLQKKESGDVFFDFSFPFVHTIPSFKVVTAILDPFTPAPSTTSFPGAMVMTFDPKDVCDAGPCAEIRFIQTVKMEGRLTADPTKTRPLTFAEQGFSPAADYDKRTTAAGWTADTLASKAPPYYLYPAPGQSLLGMSNGTTKPASLGDMPGRPSSAYPSDIDKIILSFESAAFCAKGTLKGRYLGKVLWRWEQVKGMSPVVTLISATRAQPSGEFVDAVNRWNADTGFMFPMPSFVSCP